MLFGGVSAFPHCIIRFCAPPPASIIGICRYLLATTFPLNEDISGIFDIAAVPTFLVAAEPNDNAVIAAFTKAVLATCVLFVVCDAVGVVGIPVKVGLFNGAPLRNDRRLDHPVDVELGLLVFASIVLM